jgi:hydrogenase maturation protein HypF
MTADRTSQGQEPANIEIRVRGRVQGVGFRPAVWRIARTLHLGGEVLNDAEGVLVRVAGPPFAVDQFIERLHTEAPPLARIESIATRPFTGRLPGTFRIAESAGGAVHTEISPDAAICDACAAEVRNPFEGRYRYPFTNCTHCGPRLSIIGGVPYDRAQTTMAAFDLCEACLAEYRDPADRRFHAEAIACHSCGPRASLVRFDGRAVSFDQHSMLDDVDAVCTLLQMGLIVAIKGLGGYQLACDAANADTVARLRERKGRGAKPFALMARDLDVIRRYARVSDKEEAALIGLEAPIVVLRAGGPERLADAVAPGVNTLGFMLPTAPLHLLILLRMDRPVVMTSGNIAEEPQVISDADAIERLAGITAYALIHDRDIANRVDDSVVREIGGQMRLIRRARGFAPSPIKLPHGFADAPDILALGGELKAVACLVKDGEVIPTQHLGDLENAATYGDFRKTIELYGKLFAHKPRAVVADAHPDYLSSKFADELGQRAHLPVLKVQHHHAHVASCLAENGRALDAAPVLGVVLDGLGFGDDGTIWGGEFLLADYCHYERLGCLKPVAMLGGAQAARQPWRNLYAHLMAEIGWAEFEINFAGLDILEFFKRKPRATLDAMLKRHLNAPLASSCGRLFDAFAAAVGVCRERQSYEGQTGAELEALADEATLRDPGEEHYPVAIPKLAANGLPYIEPVGMWRAALGDLLLKTRAPVMAARFHLWLAESVAAMVVKLARRDAPEAPRFTHVALTGGCFQNCILFEQVHDRLSAADFTILSQSRLPANDGGLAFGQAAIGAARLIRAQAQGQGNATCASGFPAAS